MMQLPRDSDLPDDSIDRLAHAEARTIPMGSRALVAGGALRARTPRRVERPHGGSIAPHRRYWSVAGVGAGPCPASSC